MKFSDMSSSKNNSNLMMIVVIVGAIFIGIIVFAISSLLFSKPEKNNSNTEKLETKVELELDSKKVKNLYKYVTYGEDNIFVKTPNIKLENFSDYDKYYYSGSLIKEDDVKEIEDRDSGNKLHTIDYSKIKTNMEKYFGEGVDFEKESVVTIMLPFDIDGKNICTLTYNENLTAYTVSCNEKKEINNNSYRELISAKEENNKIILKEKLFFINQKEENDKINYDIYKDYNHTILITSDDIDKKDFNLENIYKDNKKQLTTITYTFKKNKKDYYFYSSKFSD
ncbi:MAG: hypothetical protein IJF92_04900 [Bacilli bacterium]|nr:hypothetical protein [Bacilli bacterium]